jgi:hypothetical protein
MKNLKTIISMLAITLIIILSSCSKSDSSAEQIQTPVASNYRLKSDLYNIYEYNSGGLLIKVSPKSNPSQYIQYEYNANNKLKRTDDKRRPTSYDYYYTNYIYDAQGRVGTIITDLKNISSTIAFKLKDEITYNNSGKIARKDYSTWDNDTQVFNPSTSYIAFTYDTNGNITKLEQFVNNLLYTFKEISFDSKGNVIEIKEYDRKAGSTTQFYFNQRYQYTLNDKKNPGFNNYPDTAFSEYPFFNNPNFIIETISSRYNESGLTNSYTNTKPQYIYNDGGYPMKEIGATVDEYTYEKY